MSTQALVRIGEETDLYYADPKNTEKQAIAVEYNSRYKQNFSNLGPGTSTLIIPPGNGVRNIVIVLKYAASGAGAALAGQVGARALPRGWGYSAVKNITFRVAGSSQYQLSGSQLLQRNMRLCRTKSQRDSILQLGGAQVAWNPAGGLPNPFLQDQYAYIPVSVFASPSADGIALPLPGDLLSQSIQISCELDSASNFWTGTVAGPVDAGVPAAFNAAYFQVEQLIMPDRSMSLANRVDMNTHSYGMPLPDFDQQEQVIALQATAAEQSVTLTGFRAGEVKKIVVWLTKNSDTTNDQLWYAPKASTVLYGGVIYSQYEDGSSQIWNLLDGTAPSAVDQSQLSAGAGFWDSTGVLSQWAELPFAQPTGNDYDGEVLVHGKSIESGLVNLNITTPDASAYTLHAVYVYNCTLMFSKGSADLVF